MWYKIKTHKYPVRDALKNFLFSLWSGDKNCRHILQIDWLIDESLPPQVLVSTSTNHQSNVSNSETLPFPANHKTNKKIFFFMRTRKYSQVMYWFSSTSILFVVFGHLIAHCYVQVKNESVAWQQLYWVQR